MTRPGSELALVEEFVKRSFTDEDLSRKARMILPKQMLATPKGIVLVWGTWIGVFSEGVGDYLFVLV